MSAAESDKVRGNGRRRPLTASGVLLLVAVAGVSYVAWRAAMSSTAGIAGPFVQDLTESGFTVVWLRPTDGACSIQLIDADGKALIRRRVSPVDGRYVARFDELSPGVRYRYRVTEQVAHDGEEEALIGNGSARTSPPREDGRFRFLAFGDSGTGDAAQLRVARVMPSYNADLIIHTGDLIYGNDHADDPQQKLFKPYATLLANAALYPCLGNHDWEEPTSRVAYGWFALPDNGPPSAKGEIPRFYWFDYGGVRFVCIDSNSPFGELRDVVAPWLDDVLAGADDLWKVVYFHHPVYTASKLTPSGKMAELVVPLLDQYGVHLVLCGHNHLYERSRPIRDGKVIEDGFGTVYVTTGAGGGDLYPRGGQQPAFLAVQDDTQHSFTIVDVSPDVIAVSQYNAARQVVDQFTIERDPTQPQPVLTGADSANDETHVVIP